MKKVLFILLLCSSHLAFAQLSVDSYIFKVETGSVYTPLTGASNITEKLVWDEEKFKFPLGFVAKIGDNLISDFSISLSDGFGPASDTEGVVNAFMFFAASDLIDRGAIDGTPKSPLRYTLSGTAPKRIFKFELFNAGFYDEGDVYGTLNDSMNMQIWLYETSNIVEFHFGPSKISKPSDYFYLGGSPMIGYVKNADLSGFTFTKLFSLKGSFVNPDLDSLTSSSVEPDVMSSYPAEGTVYRFIPKEVAASIGESVIASDFRVYPTSVIDEVYVESLNELPAIVSLLNLNGQKMMDKQNINKGKNAINIGFLPAGTYFLQVKTENGSGVYKFSKL